MKKNYNIGSDVRSSDSLEITRRLYKNITEIAKKLEEHKNRALTTIDIFTPTGEALRSKLKDYCERLIINDPVNHVQKTEELLWRRCCYDIVSAAKKLRKGNAWNETEEAFLSVHLSVGAGFYHHLILRLLLEYDLKLPGVIDFAYTQNQKEIIHMEKGINKSKVPTLEVKKCVTRFIHRSLICLGDLARYQLDLEPHWDPQVAIRYYKMAVAVDDKYGMPHNQLGTVAGNKNYGLDAVYHYLRSILCLEPFEGAEGNLKRTVIVHSYTGKEKCLTQSCVARLLLLLQLWDSSSMNIDKINQESQTLLNDIENCLNVEKTENVDQKSAENEDSIEKYLLHHKTEETVYLTDEMIFKIIVICLMKIMKVQMKEPNDGHGITAFVLAVFSQVLQFVVMRLQESLLDLSITNKDYNSNKAACTKEIAENKNGIESTEKTDNEKDFNDKSLQDSLNNLKSFTDDTKTEINGNHVKRQTKKRRDKSKSLLTKLRRPRNRKNSSDSDVSDGEGVAIGSSSEDVNSDITETEEDVISDENVLSDDALSDDLTDDEKEDNEVDVSLEKMNGNIAVEDKFIQENENETKDKTNINDIIVNEKENTMDETADMTKNPDSTYDENNASANTLTYVAQMEKQNLDPIKVLKVLKDEKILTSIKVCCDWLQGQRDIIRTCAKGSKSLLKRLITLLNLINLDSESVLKKWDKDLDILPCTEKAKEAVKIVPLPEDIDLKGLKIVDAAHKNINWDILNRKKMTNCEETLLRALKIVEFGHYLCSMSESGVTYDKSKGLFIIANEETNETKENQVDNKTLEIDQSKGKLMRHMGRLWLKAEVRALESRLHYRLMSPYLVPDHEAFSKFMPVIKQLVYAKKFIVVVPSVVICALDEMKKVSSHAREATRWIEGQLQRGSRFLRAQRPHEKLPLPLIKGPKPKDKEAWLYFQIIECCHFLTQQSKAGDSEIPVVTLLTGIDDKKLFTFSPDGIAKSAGVNFEHIGAFHAKWKLSIKSHG
ncbi:protein SMG5 isoform X1 [Nasonia vitripennis]|uniref:Protein SMG5 n=2 Tax=Nasonia vitripennis TaxID=7425 RepID=A0A7M7G142_NASVI|nr:protein SMG5 isoform X1 [Nasonia vitripennis]